MLGRRASGPPLCNGLCFQLSFLLRGIHHGSSHPTGPQHLETPAPIVPGNSPHFLFPWVIDTPTVLSNLGRSSIILPIFCCFPSLFFFPFEGLWPLPWVEASMVKLETYSTHLSSNLKVEPYHQHWREKQALTCPTVVSPGDKTKAFLITEVDRRAIPRLSSCCGQSQVPNPKGTESVAEWDQQQALWGKPGAVWEKARGGEI